MRFCKSHCSACRRHFTSDGAFDAHRETVSESPNYRRECRDPYELKKDGALVLVEASDDGTCRLSGEIEYPVTIWKFNLSADQVAQLRGLSEPDNRANEANSASIGGIAP